MREYVGLTVLVLEYCDTDLFAIATKHANINLYLDPTYVYEYLLPALRQGLQQIRAKSLVHLDLRPENILHCFTGFKIADFDRSVVLEKKKEYRMTNIVGGKASSRFAAPEVLTEQKFSYSADLYSLGAILEWCLTGHVADPTINLNAVAGPTLNLLISTLRLPVSTRLTWTQFTAYDDRWRQI